MAQRKLTLGFSFVVSLLLAPSAFAQAPSQPQTAAATGPAAVTPPSATGLPPAAPAAATSLPAGSAPFGASLAASDQASDLQQTLESELKLRPAAPAPAADESLFFTPWQHALLQEAKRGFLTKPPGSATASAEEASKPTIREISLAGIVYRSAKDWTIYLNNQRVTPDALPDQVMDLKVHDTYIDLKWFDTANNLIFPIRLREHQRFNLDGRIFLPGLGAETASSTP